MRIEADTNNSNETHNARIELYQDGALHGAFIGFDESWGGNAPDNLFRIGTRSSGQNNYNNITINANNGTVGIGTTDTKGYKLGVSGKIAAEEIKVALYNNWPDYVFEDAYNLPTLEEVENHIDQKGHLINIPSAAEVEENGIQLGEMNAKLLEKIEELTLYTIAQEKEIKELQKVKAKNSELEARLTKIEALLLERK